MPYVTSVERIGIKKGLQQGLQKGIEQGIKQGMQQGMQQGLQQGMQQGLAGLLLRQMQKKFGTLADKQLITRVSTASTDELERWGERLLTASKPSEIFEQE